MEFRKALNTCLPKFDAGNSTEELSFFDLREGESHDHSNIKLWRLEPTGAAWGFVTGSKAKLGLLMVKNVPMWSRDAPILPVMTFPVWIQARSTARTPPDIWVWINNGWKLTFAGTTAAQAVTKFAWSITFYAFSPLRERDLHVLAGDTAREASRRLRHDDIRSLR